MKIETLLANVTDVFLAVKPGGKKGDDALARLDRGILDVALMIAALDGEILPAEVASYYRLLGKCRGTTKKDAQASLDAALHKAGYLIARKQMGTDDKGCLEAFVREATAALPAGFAEGSLADLRRAFVFWLTMGLSDGTFSPLERAAVQALADGFAKVRCTTKGKKGKVTSLPLLEPDFLEKAEKLVKDLSNSARREKALAALTALISTVSVSEGGSVVQKAAAGITVRAGLIAMLVAAGLSTPGLADQALPFGGMLFGFSF